MRKMLPLFSQQKHPFRVRSLWGCLGRSLRLHCGKEWGKNHQIQYNIIPLIVLLKELKLESAPPCRSSGKGVQGKKGRGYSLPKGQAQYVEGLSALATVPKGREMSTFSKGRNCWNESARWAETLSLRSLRD